MEIRDNRIDSGKAFDWGRTSKEYAKYRDIYPEIFYKKIIDRDLCISGQKLLDRIAPEKFDVLHYAALAVLRKKG